MSEQIQPIHYSTQEELFNSISHGLGLLLAIVGLVLLIIEAQGILQISSVSVYGGSLILMFLVSTLYHAAPISRLKIHLKLIDHSAIYILIAGTYTPLMLVGLEDNWGMLGTILIWTLAAIGVSFKLFFKHKHPKLSLFTYLVMGWLAIAFIYPIYQSLDAGGLILLALGGAFFTFGVYFYIQKHKQYTHAIWHLFVVGGCVCHFFSIYNFVI